MEFKDLTQELVHTNRPDLENYFLDAGAKSRDDEVTKLEQERDAAVKENDELKIKQAKSKREILVDKAIAESDMPDYAKTDAFRKQLLQVKETKDGDKTVSIEDGVKALIQDRMDVLDPAGVTDNTGKEINQSKQKGKVTNEKFKDAFTS